MTSPHIQLGNTASDIGSGINSFTAGLLAQRQRQQQMALQEALQKSQTAHLDAQTAALPQTTASQVAESGARTGLIGAQTRTAEADEALRAADASPADDEDELRLRMIDERVPQGAVRGLTKRQAAEYAKVLATARLAQQRLGMSEAHFENRGQVVSMPDGSYTIVYPNQPGGGISGGGHAPAPAAGGMPGTAPSGGGGPAPLPGVGKATTGADRKQAGSALAAKSANDDMRMYRMRNPRLAEEVASILSKPGFAALPVNMIPGMTHGGRSIEEVMQAFRLQGASPEAQAWVKRMFDFVGLVGPVRYGLRGMQSPRTLQQLWSDFGYGQYGLTPEGMNAADKNRDMAINQMMVQAGRHAMEQGQQVFQDNPGTTLSPATSPYGYTKRY